MSGIIVRACGSPGQATKVPYQLSLLSIPVLTGIYHCPCPSLANWTPPSPPSVLFPFIIQYYSNPAGCQQRFFCVIFVTFCDRWYTNVYYIWFWPWVCALASTQV